MLAQAQAINAKLQLVQQMIGGSLAINPAMSQTIDLLVLDSQMLVNELQGLTMGGQKK